VTHAALLDAIQVQSRVVSMAIVPDAPSADASGSELDADTWHLGAVGAFDEIDDEPQPTDMSATPNTRIPLCATIERRTPISVARCLQSYCRSGAKNLWRAGGIVIYNGRLYDAVSDARNVSFGSRPE